MRLSVRALCRSCSNSWSGHVVETQCCDLPDHVFVMRSGPINPPAGRTLYEACLRGKNVRRHAVLDLRLGYRDNWLVAPGTAREGGSQRIDRKGGKHLSELIAEMITFDEEERLARPPTQQAAVAGQDRSGLGARMADQRLAGEVCSVRGILSDDAQPRSQAAQHFVDGESMGHGTLAALANIG
jgi:hypothetical protein